MIKFEVPGRPIQQGSMKAFVAGGRARITHDKGKDLMEFRSRVGYAARAAGASSVRGPMVIDLTFVMPRPKSHYGTGKNLGRLKATAPKYVCSKPDLDKLIRSVLDGLTNIAFADDSQVVTITARKQYGEEPLTRVILWEDEMVSPSASLITK